MRKIILLLVLFISAFSSEILNKTYYIDSHEIFLNDIVKTDKSETILFNIPEHKHSKKIKSKILVKLLKEHNYKNYKTKKSYINFIIKSPIDTSHIKDIIKQYYESKYDTIDIHNITVEPRAYIVSIPKKYNVKIRKNNYLKNSGTISIKTLKNRKIFFDYTINANIQIYKSRKKIKKSQELSAINTKTDIIFFEKFRAKPITHLNNGILQAKHHINIDKILTLRDVEILSLIKRGSKVKVSVNDENIAISFIAKALQNGKINDLIKVKKSNGKVLKVIITGRNTAEIR